MKGLAKMITMLIMLTLLIEKEKKRMEKEANGQSYTTHIYTHTQYMNAHINTIRFSRLITIIKMRRKENLIHQQIKTKKKKDVFTLQIRLPNNRHVSSRVVFLPWPFRSRDWYHETSASFENPTQQQKQPKPGSAALCPRLLKI